MLGRERARYFISTNYKDEHAGNCAIAVGFKGATRVSWSVIIVAPLPPRSGGTSISTSPPAACCCRRGWWEEEEINNVKQIRYHTYFCDPFKSPDLLISLFLTRGSFVCLCVFTSVVGIRKSVNPFPHEIEVAFINKTGMRTVVVV